ncbi:ATP-binding protein [Spiroplasma tabanidicola]|uniref:AAA family ATPase n=1 Tax=Spiroplasma tabanidicola TaxID=324079 RepID=A0A6I6CBR1_9MOLU|nr:ATP-binding protein [Spiroplasma tabanidicola]QGS51414.1 AAA family ATPase [Spiroplasma tabanidicola]
MKAQIHLKDLINIIEKVRNNIDKETISILKSLSKDISNQGYSKEASYILDLMGIDSVTFANKDVLFGNDKNFELLTLENNYKDFLINDNDVTYFRLKKILENEKVLYKFNGIKLIIEGRPGSGKTSLIKNLAKSLEKKLYSVSAAKIVSSKLGETQKNIETLFQEINQCNDAIILFDEFDSLIGSRDRNINDEYHRMIGVFNNCVDNLKPGLIFVAITNKQNFIDESTIRRFNMKITMNNIDIAKLMLLLQDKSKGLEINFNEKLIEKIFSTFIDEINYSFPEEIILNAILYEQEVEQAAIKLLNIDENQLLEKGFSLRDLQTITGMSRSTLQRMYSKETG